MSEECIVEYQGKVTQAIESDIDAFKYVNSPYYAQVAPLIDQYRAAVVVNTTNPVDQDLLVSNTTALNLFVQNERASSNTFSTSYPYIEERIELTPFITPAETQTFIDNYLYDPYTFTTSLTPYNPNLLVSLNDYFGPSNFSSSGMSSFCSLVPNIFAQFQQLRDAFSQVESFVADFTQLLSDIQDFSLAGLLESLKQQMLSIVDRMVANVKAKIAEFTSLFTEVSNFRWNLNGVHSKVIKEKEKIQALISDPSIDNLKLTLEGALSFASSLFESLKIEEIQFLILRFCELISNLENFFTDVTRPLQDTMDNYKSSFNALRGAGSYREARAIAAGAIRFGITERTAGMNTAAAVPATSWPGADGISEGGVVPGGGAVRQRSARAEPITAAEADEAGRYMTYEAVYLNATSPYVLYQPGPDSARGGRFGWDNVQPLEKVMLMRLAKALGTKLYINSAWRSLETQAKIRSESSNPSAIPKSGYHQAGQAFDVSRRSFGNENTFINTARSLGFGGIGRYDTFIHIDSRFGDLTFK